MEQYGQDYIMVRLANSEESIVFSKAHVSTLVPIYSDDDDYQYSIRVDGAEHIITSRLSPPYLVDHIWNSLYEQPDSPSGSMS